MATVQMASFSWLQPVLRVIGAGRAISRITLRYKGVEFPACNGVSMDGLIEGYGLGWG